MIESALQILLIFVGLLVLLRLSIFGIKYSEQAIRGFRPKVLSWNRFCTRCEQEIGRFECVFSVKELLLGGWSCPRCGSEFDQVNELRIPHSIDAHLRDPVARSHGRKRRSLQSGKSPVERIIEEE